MTEKEKQGDFVKQLEEVEHMINVCLENKHMENMAELASIQSVLKCAAEKLYQINAGLVP